MTVSEKIKAGQLDAIIFDLGGVILNLDIEASILAFQRLAPKMHAYEFNGASLQHPLFSSYEVGKLSSQEFRSQFNQIYHASLGDHEFDACWNAMILELELKRLHRIDEIRSQGVKAFLLSNTNEIHEAAFLKRFDELNLDRSFESFFDQVYYSHRIQKRKPNSEAFLHVLNDHGLTPSRTLFIDDSAQHIEGAGKLGIQTIHLKKPMGLLEVLG